MNSNDGAIYFVTGLIVLGLWTWAIHAIIRSASKANTNIYYQKRIYRILNEIALKSGVDPEDVDAIKRDLPVERQLIEDLKKP
jgi:hypothetical protein